ncbi:hypothetical protein EWM64_g10226, partial [Hericium alpestre]
LEADAEPIGIRNYLDDSDQEEDPPSLEATETIIDDDADVFTVYDHDIPSTHLPPPCSPSAASAPQSLNPFHISSDSQTPAEHDNNPSNVAKSVPYQGAARVLCHDADVRSAYQAQMLPTTNIYEPFDNCLDWELAKWAKQQDVSQNAFTTLLKIPGFRETLELSYNDSRSLNQTIDQLPRSAPWQTAPIEVSHESCGPISTDFFFRDALESIKTIYGNPAFTKYMAFAPEKQYSNVAKDPTDCIYNEMHTGDWWWSTQAKLGDGATVVPVILSSDKTQLTTFNSGEKTAYPMYATIGNIAKDIRRKPSLHAQMLIGYLPTPDLSSLSEEHARTVRARLFHAALTVITESLRGPEHDGVELTSGDGAVRRCHPIIAVYVADYPEQSLVACTRQGSQCPKCHAVEIEFEEHKLPWKRRKQDETLKSLKHGAQQPSARRQESVLKAVGLTHVIDPFWKGFLYSNIHDAITPDILHQLLQGLLSYLIAWATSIVGLSELDARFKTLPPMHGVRSFTNGINGLVRVSGGEHKQICKQLLGCIVGKAPACAVNATRALLEFLHLAVYDSHSEETLLYMQTALDDFHKDKDIFLELKAHTPGHFNLPKLHSLQHYVDTIRERGTTDNYNTEATERLHIDYAKDAYRATNKHDYLEQMVNWLDRRERVAIFDVHLHYRQNTLPPLQLPQAVIPGHVVAKRANHRSVLFTRLISDYHAQHFVHALETFIATYCKLSPRQRCNDPIIIPFNHVEVWDRVKFRLQHLQLDDAPPIMDTAVAIPTTASKAAQFSTVLVVVGDDAEETGVRASKCLQPDDFHFTKSFTTWSFSIH